MYKYMCELMYNTHTVIMFVIQSRNMNGLAEESRELPVLPRPALQHSISILYTYKFCIYTVYNILYVYTCINVHIYFFYYLFSLLLFFFFILFFSPSHACIYIYVRNIEYLDWILYLKKIIYLCMYVFYFRKFW